MFVKSQYYKKQKTIKMSYKDESKRCMNLHKYNIVISIREEQEKNVAINME